MGPGFREPENCRHIILVYYCIYSNLILITQNHILVYSQDRVNDCNQSIKRKSVDRFPHLLDAGMVKVSRTATHFCEPRQSHRRAAADSCMAHNNAVLENIL